MTVQAGQTALASDIVNSTAHYAADAGASDTYAISLPTSPGSYVTGATFRFKANTANTGAATLNVNSLGAKTIKKNYNEDLTTNDILANQIVSVIYDGTNFQLLSNIRTKFAVGTTTRAGDTASGSQTIAHGLGCIPRKVKITAMKGSSAAAIANYSLSVGAYDGTTTGGIHTALEQSDYTSTGTSGSIVELWDDESGSNNQSASISVDATNITLAWTKVGSPSSDNIKILWEAEA